MVPFLKASAEIDALRTKVAAEEMKKMRIFTASNDDKYHGAYYGYDEETKAVNE